MELTKKKILGICFFIISLVACAPADSSSTTDTIVSEDAVKLRSRLFDARVSDEMLCRDFRLFHQILSKVQIDSQSSGLINSCPNGVEDFFVNLDSALRSIRDFHVRYQFPYQLSSESFPVIKSCEPSQFCDDIIGSPVVGVDSDFDSFLHAVIPTSNSHQTLRLLTIANKNRLELFESALSDESASYSEDFTSLNLATFQLLRQSFDYRPKNDFQIEAYMLDTRSPIKINVSYEATQTRGFDYTNGTIATDLSEKFSLPCGKEQKILRKSLSFCISEDNRIFIRIDRWLSLEEVQDLTDLVRNEIEVRNRKMRSIYIDIRGNSGGSTKVATEMLCILSDEGILQALENRIFRSNYLPISIFDGKERINLKSLVSEAVNLDFFVTSEDQAGQTFEVDYLERNRLDPDACRALQIKQLEKVPLAVLTNGREFSASESFLSFVKDSTRGIIIGRKSRGGTGSPVTLRLPNTGVEIRLSRSRQVDTIKMKEVIEADGVSPDVRIAYLDLIENFETKLMNYRPDAGAYSLQENNYRDFHMDLAISILER